MLRLYIGDKNYSTWSMRPWLVLQHFEIPFQEQLIPFDDFQLDSPFKQKILQINPTGKVPVLVDDDGAGNSIVVWDTLAICEYLVEKFPEKHLYPMDFQQRVRARCITAEMHSGFMTLRSTCEMNLDAKLHEVGAHLWQKHVTLRAEVSRIEQIWQQRPQLNGFLCGDHFTIADGFYAPVVMRFLGYGLPVSKDSQQYMQQILAVPTVQQWIEEAQAEFRFVTCEEPYRKQT